jgi:hypothetical protein
VGPRRRAHRHVEDRSLGAPASGVDGEGLRRVHFQCRSSVQGAGHRRGGPRGECKPGRAARPGPVPGTRAEDDEGSRPRAALLACGDETLPAEGDGPGVGERHSVDGGLAVAREAEGEVPEHRPVRHRRRLKALDGPLVVFEEPLPERAPLRGQDATHHPDLHGPPAPPHPRRRGDGIRPEHGPARTGRDFDGEVSDLQGFRARLPGGGDDCDRVEAPPHPSGPGLAQVLPVAQGRRRVHGTGIGSDAAGAEEEGGDSRRGRAGCTKEGPHPGTSSRDPGFYPSARAERTADLTGVTPTAGRRSSPAGGPRGRRGRPPR